MPVSYQVPYSVAVANGADTYNFNFRVFESTDLVVKVAGVEKVLGTDYSVTINADPAEGGHVVFMAGKVPVAGADLVEIARDLSLDRTTDYQEAGGFRQAVVDKDFDRIIMLIQDRERRLTDLQSSAQSLSDRVNSIEDSGGYPLGVDVRHFGADDGDDLSAVFVDAQAALPADGGVILIPAGHTYTGTITITRSNVRITGGGTLKGNIRIVGTSAAKITGVAIDGIRIMQDALIPGSTGIEMSWYDGIDIRDIYCQNLDKTYYVPPIDTNAFQPNGKLNIRGCFSRNVNIDLYIDSLKNDWTTVTGDTQYEDNIVIANKYHIYGLSVDGLVAKGCTFFFPYNGTVKKQNIYLNYYDQTIISGINAFESGEEGFSLGHGARANVGGNNIIWNGQIKASSAIKIWGGDHDGGPYTLANVHDNFSMWPTLHGIETDGTSGFSKFNDNYIWGPGNTTHYKGTEDVASMTHDYIHADPASDFITSSDNIGAGTAGARFYVTGARHFSFGDAFRLSDGTIVRTGTHGRKVITLANTETSITTDGLFAVHLNHSAPTTINSISPGQENHELFLFAYNANTTLHNDNATIRLSGGTDATIPKYGSLTLIWNSGSNWWEEKSRSFERGKVVLTAPDLATTISVAGTEGQDVAGVNFNFSAPTTVTAITGARDRQEVTLLAYNGNTTIQNNATIKTADGKNITLRQYGSITMVYNAGSGWWYEKARGSITALTTTPLFAYDHTDHSVTGTAAMTQLFSTTIPGGTLGPNGALRVTILGTCTNSANNKTITVKFGNAYLLNFTVTTVASFQGMWIMRNRNVENSQVAASGGFTNFGITGSPINTSNVDTTVDQTLTVSCQLANTGETCTLNDVMVEILK